MSSDELQLNVPCERSAELIEDFSAMGRRRFLGYMGAATLGAVATPVLAAAARRPSRSGSLKEVASQKGILFGTAVNGPRLDDDHSYAELVAEQCAIITPNNELKMRYLRPDPNKFNFDAPDRMLHWAQSHGIKMRGHTLVYGEPAALPTWFDSYVNRNNARDVMVKHITTVVRHYAGKLHSWDVVNEALQAGELRQTPWLRFIGPDYLEIAYRTAAEADPNVLLVYNENNLEFAQQDAKRSGCLKLLNSLISKRAPIHALGMQSHLRWEMGGFDAGKTRKFLRQVSDMGLKIFITELDCREPQETSEIGERDRTIAQYYADYLGNVLENRNVTVVQTWNLTDRYTWLQHEAPRRDGQKVRPLPFDENLNPKPAFDAIAAAVEHAAPR
jgi:endo-1,4-beta-xylanase